MTGGTICRVLPFEQDVGSEAWSAVWAGALQRESRCSPAKLPRARSVIVGKQMRKGCFGEASRRLPDCQLNPQTTARRHVCGMSEAMATKDASITENDTLGRW